MILSTVPCRTRSRNKIKAIVHSTAYDTLIISCKSKVGLSFTCPKNWRNRPKRLKILKTEHLPRLIYRSSYVNRIRNLKKFFKFIFHLVHNHIHYICFASNYKSIYIYIFFSMWVFLHEHSRITGLQGKGKGISLTPHYHFHPLHRNLDISRAITAESSPLHIASGISP